MRSIASDTGEADVLVIGSQAIIGSHPELLDLDDDRREVIAGSLDLDVMPLDGSDRWVNTLSWMTEESVFAISNGGAHADPVAEGIASLPTGWRSPSGLQARAWVLEPHDLLASKYIAGRPNDFAFCAAVIAARIIDRETLIDRLTDIRRNSPHKALSVDVAIATVERTFDEVLGH